MRTPKIKRIREKIQVLRSEVPERLSRTVATGTAEGVREALDNVFMQQHRILALLDESLALEEDSEIY